MSIPNYGHLTRHDVKVSFLGRPKFETKGNEVKCTLLYEVRIPAFCLRYNNPNGTYNKESYFETYCSQAKAVGTAKCSANDSFDKETGRSIAAARAEAIAYRDARNFIQNYVLKPMAEVMDSCSKFVGKAEYVINHDAEYAKEMGNK